MSFRIIAYAGAIIFAASAWAATPVIYSRGEITIIPAASTGETPGYKTEGTKGGEQQPLTEEKRSPPVQRIPHNLNVEIRPEKAFIQNAGMFTQPVLDEKSGIMAVVETPGIVPIVGDNIYTPFDILFVTARGEISQIAPSVNLSELNGEIVPREPVRAFIYLQSGLCKKHDIRPHDMVTHEIFQKSPVILD